jgi:transposase-like protein
VEYAKEVLEGWRGFLRCLTDRGLKGVRVIISDACRCLVEAAEEVFPKTDWQRCVVHFCRNVFSHVPNAKVADVARMLKAIHAQEDARAASAKAADVVKRLRAMKLKSAADLVEQRVAETLTYYAYPSNHWRQIRTNNPMERVIREIRRRTRIATGAFNICPFDTASGSRALAWKPLWAPRATPTITPWPKPSLACSRQR